MSSASIHPKAPEPNVKGVAFRSVLVALRELRDDSTAEAVLASMPREQAEMLRYTIVQTGWYPVSLYRALWSAILEVTGEGYPLVRAIGGAAIRRDITGVYRVVFKVISAETIFGLSGKLFGNYYDTGTIVVTEKRPGFAHAQYTGCVGFDRAMWEELAGSGEELIRMAGGKDPRMTLVRGGYDGSPNCEMTLEWR